MAVRVRWRGLELPVQVKAAPESLTEEYGEFIAEPFERGYGHTIGNSLRRVLLSSLEGAAVVAARIDGAAQEFGALAGVRQDVAEILLNIKQLVVHMHPDEECTLRVDATGPGDVTAALITVNPDIDIVNPDHVIATLTDEVDFGCEMIVRKGRGYVPAEEHDDLPREIGLMPVDAMFSPVQRVAYEVSDTRVGRRVNYDRLALKIWTNGSVSPDMALVEASKILRKHLNPFVQYFEMGRMLPFEEREPLAPPSELTAPQVSESTLSTPIKALNLSIRGYNCLSTEGIKTIGQLLERSKDSLMAIRNFGNVTLDELHDKLEELGLEIGLLAPEEE